MLSAVGLAQNSSFRLNNGDWTYQEGSWHLHGILVRPYGPGPFPAIIISHGRGGNAEGFSRTKAEEFAKWGLVTIAVDYSFANTGSNPSDDGSSKENLRRAMKCLGILRDQSYVDHNRIAAYGNSMGAFVTIALAAVPHSGLKADIITAGGIYDQAPYAVPNADLAEKIRIPMLILHGEKDNVVPPERSEALKAILDKNKVENERVLYPGQGHNVNQTEATEVYQRIHDWLVKTKVLKSS